MPRPLLAIADTNVPMDLARGRDDVIDAVVLIRRRLRGRNLLIPPRVVRELAYLADFAEEAGVRAAAASFLRRHRQWGCQLVPDVVLGDDFVERVARQIRAARLLPPAEVNDSVIIVEAAILGASLLLTSDEHVRGVDLPKLQFLLEGFDLSAPIIATPAEIVKKFLR
jgi:predicted nucleic acid-binding protein